MQKSICNIDFPTETVEEGRIRILVPKLRAFIKTPSEYAPSKAPVFYNPVMELSRDIAVLALQSYQKMVNREISVCEPLTGSGIRGLRFAAEAKGIRKVLINDINQKAFQLANYNVQNSALGERITVLNEDANCLLGCYGAPRKRFDVIDIDPFGSPVPYLDSAVKALRNGGLLALTATDLASLCGVYPKACIRKYGGKPLRAEYCHELAVRLLAGCLATTAAKYDIGVNVIFSHSSAHYIRVYAIAEYGAKKADESIKDMGYILHCFNCFHRETAKKPFSIEHSGKCSQCGSTLSVAGPLWLGKIFNKEFCELMEQKAKQNKFRLGERIRRMLALTRIEAEAPITYYVIDKLCDALGLPAPPTKRVVQALSECGFKACLTHFNPRGIRTDASAMDMKELLRKTVTTVTW
jgi:tRNA (guanine26-N2/guanine27-N2)-dimethyltransferase